MEMKQFERYLKASSNASDEFFWDSMSQKFADTFADLHATRDNFLFDTLEKTGILYEIDSVVDIGCGVGRHSYEFNRHVSYYLGIDISSEMLKIANKNKNIHCLNNSQFKNMDWHNCDERFDLVFSAMCPTINTVSDIEKMLSISNRYVLFKRFVRDVDSSLNQLSIEGNTAHNKPEYVYGLISILWHLGYMPEVFKYQEKYNDLIHVDEFLRTYDKFFVNLPKSEKETKISKVMELADKDGNIINTKYRDYLIVLVDKRFSKTK